MGRVRCRTQRLRCGDRETEELATGSCLGWCWWCWGACSSHQYALSGSVNVRRTLRWKHPIERVTHDVLRVVREVASKHPLQVVGLFFHNSLQQLAPILPEPK